jgi:hypothetical protein
MKNRKRVTFVFAVGAVAVAMVSPASALATDRFVDKDTGNDAGSCTSQLAPCQTMAYAFVVAANSDTVRLDDSSTPYVGSVSLTNGLSLTGMEFVGGDEGSVILDGGGSPALNVPMGTAGGTLSGLTLRSTATAVQIDGSITAITNNVFDSGGVDQVDIDLNASSPTISQNTFSDLSTTVLDRGITVDNASPTIIDNDFTNQAEAIDIGLTVAAANVRVEENQITGTHPASFSNGYGVQVAKGSSVILEDNVMTSGSVTGQTAVQVAPGNNTDIPSLEMRRNQIYGYDTGVAINDTSVASLNGDVIAGSKTQGVTLFNDTAPGNGAGSLKNVTIVSAGTAVAEINNVNATLSLDSSILGDAGIDSNPPATCTITRSRGPVTTPGGDGCMNFQTAAVPNFVNAGANNYHLTANNPALIDQGDPLNPIAPENLDFDLQKRAIDGDGNCSEVRDIGADEFLPGAPTANITAGPANGSTITTSSTQFSFTNSNSCAGAAFQCSVDGAGFSACASPANVGPLAEGAHTFAVRALDLVPQAGATVSRSFTVDLPNPPAPNPPATQKKCKKGQKLKNGKCVKKKKKKK